MDLIDQLTCATWKKKKLKKHNYIMGLIYTIQTAIKFSIIAEIFALSEGKVCTTQISG